MLPRLCRPLLLALALLPAALPAQGVFRADPGRSGRFAGAGLPEGRTLAWAYRLHTPLGYPVASGGLIYAGDGRGELHAIRAEDGSLAWKLHPLRAGEAGLPGHGPPVAMFTPPLIHRDRLYTLDRDGRLYALDLETRGLAWKRRLEPMQPLYFGQEIFAHLVADDERLYLERGPKLLALGLTDGAVVWQREPLGGGELAAPALDGEGLFVSGHADLMLRLDPATGDEIWRFASGRPRGLYPVGVGSAPLAAGGRVFFGNEDGFFYALDAETGEKLWEYETPSGMGGMPFLLGGRVGFSGADAVLRLLDADTGRLWRERPLEAPGAAWPAACGGLVYFGDEAGGLRAWDPTTGQTRWTARAGAAVGAPLPLEGRVVFRSADGGIYAMR